jgi:hypothetical protein
MGYLTYFREGCATREDIEQFFSVQDRNIGWVYGEEFQKFGEVEFEGNQIKSIKIIYPKRKNPPFARMEECLSLRNYCSQRNIPIIEQNSEEFVSELSSMVDNARFKVQRLETLLKALTDKQ